MLLASVLLVACRQQDNRRYVESEIEDIVDVCDVDNVTFDGCHEFFEPAELPDSIFERMQGVSYNSRSPVDRKELRYIVVKHYDFDGVQRRGEIVCHESVAKDLGEIFKELFVARYPINSVRLVEDFNGDDEASMAANNSSCFNSRGIGGGSKLSQHAYGRAVDINPLYNPLVKVRGEKIIVAPAAGESFVDRGKSFPGKIDCNDLCHDLFTKRGWRWGGSWLSVKDYQHFEKP